MCPWLLAPAIPLHRLQDGALLLFTVFFSLLAWSLKKPSPYLGIFSYMIFPAIASLGLLVFLLGMRRESRRRRDPMVSVHRRGMAVCPCGNRHACDRFRLN